MIKRIFVAVVALVIPVAVFAYTSPGRPTGMVNDFAGILSASDRQTIEGKLSSLKSSTGVEMAVVTVNSLGGDTVENYATSLFQEWGIGNKDRDTGLLLLVALQDREMRIEVGYGLEGAVTDIQSGAIIRNVLTPAFRDGQYGAGISTAIDALTAIITKSPEAEQYLGQGNTSPSKKTNYYGLFFAAVVVMNIFARILGKTESWWLGGVIGAIIGAVIGFIYGFLMTGVVAIIILTILGLIFDFFVSKRSSGSIGLFPPFFGGGFGGSGGSGGFGGCGGGMSGGGGASGRFRLHGGCADEAQVQVI